MSAPATLAPQLTSQHLAALTRLRIAPDLLAAAGVYSVTDKQARDEGFQLSSARDMAGIVFPYLNPVTGHRTTARLRRDNPEIQADGEPKAKYLCPYGDARHFYLLPGAGSLLDDISVPALFVEAEKSVLALSSLFTRAGRKYLVIGLGGCYGWKSKLGIDTGTNGERHDVHGPLSDFERIKWASRIVIILFDANAKTNPQVRAARRALAEELESRGASVKIAELPELADVNGPDDLIFVSGDDAMLAILDSAQPFAQTAQRDAEAAIDALEADKKQNPRLALEEIAAVADPMSRELLIGKITKLKIPGLTKAVVNKVVDRYQQIAREKKVQTCEIAQQERLRRLNVDPVQLIYLLEKFYAERRHLPPDAALVEALFAVNTYTFDVFDTTPYLGYDSAMGGCGKSTSLERHELVCARPFVSVLPTPATVYRKIDRDKPTYQLDEARVLQIHGDRSQELLALFDAGYKRGARVPRCDDHGNELREFEVYCPKIVAKVGSFKGTLLDRLILIHLERAKLRQRQRRVLERQAAPLREKLEAYALQRRAQLEEMYKTEPDDGYWSQISGREAEIWGPLLMHARLAGLEIEKRALEVALRFSGQKGQLAVAEDRQLALAQEVLEVLQGLSADVFSPKDIVQQLLEKEVWGEHLEDRKNLKAQLTAVGSFFRNFRVASRHTQSGTVYDRSAVIAALERHLPTATQQDDSMTVSVRPTDTSDSEVSALQATDNTELTHIADTLTPQTGGSAPIEEEL